LFNFVAILSSRLNSVLYDIYTQKAKLSLGWSTVLPHSKLSIVGL